MIAEQLHAQEDFSDIERSIATYFVEQGMALQGQSARSIAARLYTAPSTVSRLCKRLGFGGYTDFRDAYLDELRYLSSAFTDIDANQPFRKDDDTATIAAKMGALWRETVTDTMSLVEAEQLQRACDLICDAPTVVAYSAGPQAYLAQDFADKMARIGHKVLVALREDLAFFLANSPDAGDVFVIMSYSGETPTLMRTARCAHERGARVVAITSYGRNALSQLADVTLHVSTREKLVEKLGAFAMNISTLLLLDILYSCVLARDYERNAIGRVVSTHEFEPLRDSSNPILHDRRD